VLLDALDSVQPLVLLALRQEHLAKVAPPEHRVQVERRKAELDPVRYYLRLCVVPCVRRRVSWINDIACYWLIMYRPAWSSQ
jgi:hypothetical protein